MTTLNEIADNFAASIGKPFDFALKQRIKYSVKYWKAILVRREFERGGYDPSLLQGIVIPLEWGNRSHNCTGVTASTLVKKGMPFTPINTHGVTPFTYVGTLDGCIPFQYSGLSEIKYASSNRFAKDVPRYRYINGKIELYGEEACPLKNLLVEGYPEDLSNFLNCLDGESSCIVDDQPYPIGLHMLQIILEGMRKNELSVLTPNEEVRVGIPEN